MHRQLTLDLDYIEPVIDADDNRIAKLPFFELSMLYRRRKLRTDRQGNREQSTLGYLEKLVSTFLCRPSPRINRLISTGRARDGVYAS